jgi:hypothetical protein
MGSIFSPSPKDDLLLPRAMAILGSRIELSPKKSERQDRQRQRQVGSDMRGEPDGKVQIVLLFESIVDVLTIQ